jgi:hypothetical protein
VGEAKREVCVRSRIADIVQQSRNPDDDHRRAANGYLVWPLAVANIVRDGDDATIWARIHARQAVVLGVVASGVFVLVLAFPLVAVIAIPSMSIGATIGVYTAGLVADVVVGVAFLILGLGYAARAGRGELFSIPLVTPAVDRWFGVKRT